MRKKGEKEGGMSVFTSLFMKLFALAMRRSDDKRDRGLQEPSSLTAYRDVRYAPSGGKEHLLDVYTTAEEGETLPALVSVHGGGFCYGDKERYRFYCMRLALQGYTVFNFNYRLLPARFPAPLEDLNDVMLFLAAHAREYRAKADEVYAVGDSAGALILSVYAGITSSPRLRGELCLFAALAALRRRPAQRVVRRRKGGRGFLRARRAGVDQGEQGSAPPAECAGVCDGGVPARLSLLQRERSHRASHARICRAFTGARREVRGRKIRAGGQERGACLSSGRAFSPRRRLQPPPARIFHRRTVYIMPFVVPRLFFS